MVDDGAGFGGQQYLIGEVEGYRRGQRANLATGVAAHRFSDAAPHMEAIIATPKHQGPTTYRLGIVGHHARFVFQRRFDAFAAAHPPDADATGGSRPHGESVHHS